MLLGGASSAQPPSSAAGPVAPWQAIYRAVSRGRELITFSLLTHSPAQHLLAHPAPGPMNCSRSKDVFHCIFAAWRVSIGTVLLVLCHMPLSAGCPAYSCLSFSMGATFPPPAEIFPSDSTWLLPCYRSSCDSDPRAQLPFLFLSFFSVSTAGIILRKSKSVSSKEHTSSASVGWTTTMRRLSFHLHLGRAQGGWSNAGITCNAWPSPTQCTQSLGFMGFALSGHLF